MKNEKNYHDLYEDFVRRLISGDYSLYEEDKELTELIFSSKISFPGLTQIPSYLFKMNYLTEKLSHEFTKINIDVTPQEIIDNILKEKTLIYHKKKWTLKLTRT
ncbi:MAG: hypothetical protein GY754_32800 [bacterium]|nr:hypothetical protein [bacterium]